MVTVKSKGSAVVFEKEGAAERSNLARWNTSIRWNEGLTGGLRGAVAGRSQDRKRDGSGRKGGVRQQM